MNKLMAIARADVDDLESVRPREMRSPGFRRAPQGPRVSQPLALFVLELLNVGIRVLSFGLEPADSAGLTESRILRAIAEYMRCWSR